MKKISFILIVFLSQSSVFSRESFFDPSVVNTEEEFLIEQRKELNRYQKKIEYYSKLNVCNDRCQRNLEITRNMKERTYKKVIHAKILVREELSGRLWKCVDDLRAEKLFPCFESEMNYLNKVESCNNKISGFTSKESKSCLVKIKKELESFYSESKICMQSKYLLGTDVNYRLNRYKPYYNKFIESPSRTNEQNEFLKKFYKCTNEQYHAADRFIFNPEINDFLSGSKKTKYLNLLKENSSVSYLNQAGKVERQLFFYRPSYREGSYLLRFNNSMFEQRLTGKETFIKKMIAGSKYNKNMTDVEAAKLYFQREVPISSPDNSTKIQQSADNGSFTTTMKHSYKLDSSGDYVTGWSQVDTPITKEFSRYLPEFNDMGLVVWKDRDKGQVSWIKLDDKLLEVLDGYVQKIRGNFTKQDRKHDRIVVKNLIGERALVFTVHFEGNVFEYKAVIERVGNIKKYVYQDKYEGYATNEHKYQSKRRESKKTSKNNEVKKISNPEQNDVKSSGDENEIVQQIKEQDIASGVEKDSLDNSLINHKNNVSKEISNVSVKGKSYQTLIKNCRESVNNLDLEEIYTERTNSFLSMVDNLDKINCSSVEGKGCHSEEARKLIMKHYYLEKESHQKARIWKDDSDHENAEECLRLYGFAR